AALRLHGPTGFVGRVSAAPPDKKAAKSLITGSPSFSARPAWLHFCAMSQNSDISHLVEYGE
ncbi:hypothetical protein, partial [Enterobacter mori]|uniref:hypothetical protein n=1 Tax=Enterobacter mori TaxID=539813 RepID=UPI003B841637